MSQIHDVSGDRLAAGDVVGPYCVDAEMVTTDRRDPASVTSEHLELDWITPLPADTLLARGMMGDGHIDFETFASAVTAAGYTGDVEVEIFNADIWAARGDDVVATMARRYVELIEPHL